MKVKLMLFSTLLLGTTWTNNNTNELLAFGFSLPAGHQRKVTTTLRPSYPDQNNNQERCNNVQMHNKDDAVATKTTSNRNVVAKIFDEYTAAGASLVAAMVVATNAALFPLLAQPANALELSRGAFVIETTTTSPSGGDTQRQSFRAARIDSQSLLKTILTNRKALSASLQRIETAVKTELTSQPVWKELQKELLDIEGDFVPNIQVTGPSDWTQTVKDLSQGKINFLFNGEIVNVVVEPTFGSEEDDLIIRVSGFKGQNINPIITNSPEQRMGPMRAKLSELTEFWDFWGAPFPREYLPADIDVTNGQVILTGSAGTIVTIYVGAYTYYLNEQEKGNAAAEAKRQQAKERAAAAAAAAAAKKQQKEKEDAVKQEGEEKKKEEKLQQEESTKQQQKEKMFDEQQSPEIGNNEEASNDTDTNPSEGSKDSEPDDKKRGKRFRFWKKD